MRNVRTPWGIFFLTHTEYCILLLSNSPL